MDGLLDLNELDRSAPTRRSPSPAVPTAQHPRPRKTASPFEQQPPQQQTMSNPQGRARVFLLSLLGISVIAGIVVTVLGTWLAGRALCLLVGNPAVGGGWNWLPRLNLSLPYRSIPTRTHSQHTCRGRHLREGHLPAQGRRVGGPQAQLREGTQPTEPEAF